MSPTSVNVGIVVVAAAALDVIAAVALHVVAAVALDVVVAVALDVAVAVAVLSVLLMLNMRRACRYWLVPSLAQQHQQRR